jgi:ABC-type multidrug transport system fused ATPase/permease subunit
VAAGEISFD